MLKSLGVGILAGLAPLAASPAALAQTPAIDLSGAWQVTGEITAGPMKATATPLCVFKQTGKQTGAQLSGACDGSRAQGPANGSVRGRHVSWQWHATSKALVGMAGTSSFEGDLGADGVIRGTWTTTKLADAKGTFSAQRH